MFASGRRVKLQIFHGHHDEKLKCPYKGCEKKFDKPTVITDTSVIPRETHYACPYCMSKLEIATQNQKIISVKPTEYPMSSIRQLNALTSADSYMPQEKPC